MDKDDEPDIETMEEWDRPPIFILDKKRMLPLILAAYGEHRLQAQQHFEKKPYSPACLYEGPCSIGVCMPEGVRKTCDKAANVAGDTDIESLTKTGLVACPDEELAWWCTLQATHDQMLRLKAQGADYTPTQRRFEQLIGYDGGTSDGR